MTKQLHVGRPDQLQGNVRFRPSAAIEGTRCEMHPLEAKRLGPVSHLILPSRAITVGPCLNHTWLS